MKGWLSLLDKAPRRKLEPEPSTAADAVLPTDGYCPEERKGQMGKPHVKGALFQQGGQAAPKLFSEHIEESMMENWIQQKNQTSTTELVAPILGSHKFKEQLTTRSC